MKKIAIIFGGQSNEHNISLASAHFVLKNIDKNKYEIYPIGITRDGLWFEYNGSIDNIENGDWEKDEFYKIPSGERALFNKEIQLVFPLLHGICGEDGTIQGLCKLLKIPCVGSGVLSSALCMDKVYSKFILEDFNIKITPYIVINRIEYKNKKLEIIEDIEKLLGEKLFVKPSNGGSSFGVSKVNGRVELEKGIEFAFKYDKRILIEKAIEAREIKVALLGNDIIEIAKIGEIIYDKDKEFFDYELKYTDGKNILVIPSDINEETLVKIEDTSKKAYKLLDCAGMARVDFFLDKNTGEVYLNKINTIPGFTKNSSYPKLWLESGIGYSLLIDKLIELSNKD